MGVERSESPIDRVGDGKLKCAECLLYVRSPLLLYIFIHSTNLCVNYLAPRSLASLVAQLVKNLPAMWETWVQSLGWEDPLEKGKATHSSILAWRIPWTV